MRTIKVEIDHMGPRWPRLISDGFAVGPGEVTKIEVPAGFYWRASAARGFEVYPGWWRRLKHWLTGRW